MDAGTITQVPSGSDPRHAGSWTLWQRDSLQPTSRRWNSGASDTAGPGAGAGRGADSAPTDGAAELGSVTMAGTATRY